MKFFSGFCLNGEYELFKPWLNSNSYTVAGFSYGAQKALEYAITTKTRVDRLQLFSPAFFNNKDNKFKKLQLIYFAKDKDQYIENFLNNCANSCNVDLKKYLKLDSKDDLKNLLYYQWQKDKIEFLLNKGITIEVFLGESDKITDSKEALSFFKDITTTYYIKKANHILKVVND